MSRLRNTSRLLSVVLALSSRASLTRERLSRTADWYSIHSDQAWKRRLYEDLSTLRSFGFAIEGADENPMSFAWPHRIVLDAATRQSIVEAARSVGRSFFLEDPLRLAIWKLAGEFLLEPQGEVSLAFIPESNRTFAAAAVRSATSGRAVYRQGSKEKIAIHGVGIGIGPVVAITAGARGRARFETLDSLRPSVGKVPGPAFNVRSRIATSAMRIPDMSMVTTRRSHGISCEASSRCWMLAQLLDRGASRSLTELARLVGSNAEKTTDDLRALTLVNGGGGQYLMFAGIDGDAVDYEPEIHSDLLARNWPLTPLEAQATYAALALSDDRVTTAKLELASGIANRIHRIDSLDNDSRTAIAA